MQLLFGSSPPLNLASHTVALIISNEKMNDIMKIVNSLEEFDILIKVVSETIQNEVKKKKDFSVCYLQKLIFVNRFNSYRHN